MRYLDEQLSVDVPPDEILRGVGQSVSQVSRVTVTSTAPGQLVVTETWRPFWTILLAILLFPIGLLALLVKREAVIVVNAVATGADTHVDLSGRGRRWVCAPILALFGRE